MLSFQHVTYKEYSLIFHMNFEMGREFCTRDTPQRRSVLSSYLHFYPAAILGKDTPSLLLTSCLKTSFSSQWLPWKTASCFLEHVILCPNFSISNNEASSASVSSHILTCWTQAAAKPDSLFDYASEGFGPGTFCLPRSRSITHSLNNNFKFSPALSKF